MADITFNDMPRLKRIYNEKIRASLLETSDYKNEFELPKIEKIVLNIGVGAAVKDTKKVKFAQEDLTLIAGQKAVITKAKKSIAGFKVREGMPLGVKVTLRGNKMYEFLDRLITIALPRSRDFQGLPKKSVDGSGNYSFGLKEHIVFPEIHYDNVDTIWGLDVVICTTASNDNQVIDLLRQFNVPFLEV